MEKITSSIKETFLLLGLDGKISILLAALAILIIGSIVAKIIKKIVFKICKKTKLDNKIFGDKAGEMKIEHYIASFVYFLVMLFVVMLVLSTLGMESVLDPIKNLLDEFLSYVPNIVGAGIIAFIGYLLAKVVSNLIGMGSSIVNSFAEKLNIMDTSKVISIIQKVVFGIIFIIFIIQALDTLNIEAISNPANHILSSVLGFLPKILAAGIIISLFVIGGKYLTDFLKDLLKNVGLDTLSEKMQLDVIIGKNQSLTGILSGLAYFFITYFGILSGIEILELDQLNEILRSVLDLTGQILFGLVILIIGNFIANFVSNMLSKTDNNAFIASIVKGAIIALFLAISLRTMGIANSIIELAFGLILGAIAVTIALSYGLGGREAAGEHMKEILNKFRKK